MEVWHSSPTVSKGRHLCVLQAALGAVWSGDPLRSPTILRNLCTVIAGVNRENYLATTVFVRAHTSGCRATFAIIEAQIRLFLRRFQIPPGGVSAQPPPRGLPRATALNCFFVWCDVRQVYSVWLLYVYLLARLVCILFCLCLKSEGRKRAGPIQISGVLASCLVDTCCTSVGGAVPVTGQTSVCSVSRSPPRHPRKHGAAHGPRHPVMFFSPTSC